MKVFLALSVCLFFGLNIFAQTDKIETETEIAVEEISLARDDGKGNAGEISDSFLTTNVPIHCFVQLNAAKAVSIKMNLVAVKALNLKPESRIVSVNFKTGDRQDSVNFTASPEKIWSPGDYRVDIFLDGKLARSKIFTITKEISETSTAKPALPKTAARPKVVRKSKKNQNK